MANPLDSIFQQADEEVETFADTLKKQGLLVDPDTESRLVSDRPQPIALPQFIEQTQGYISINHGWHVDDYVWHISPAHFKKPWRVATERVVYAIAQVLNSVIPNTVEVKIWLPAADWEIKEITFKAIDLGGVWSISGKMIEDLNTKLFTILNKMV